MNNTVNTLLPCKNCKKLFVDPTVFQMDYPEHCDACRAKIMKDMAGRHQLLFSPHSSHPMRTRDEYNDIMTELSKRGHFEICAGCQLKFPAVYKSMISEKFNSRFLNDDLDRNNSVPYVMNRVWPYAAEIEEDFTEHWLCNPCADLNAEDI